MSKLNLFVILALISGYTHAESTLTSAVEIEHTPETAVALPPVETSPALNLNAFSTVQQIIPALAEGRVVFKRVHLAFVG